MITEERTYAKYINETLVQTAKLKLLGIGKYCFETSLFNESPFELNMNMPMFDTEKQAYSWIDRKPKWVEMK